MKRILSMIVILVGFIASAQEYQYVPIVREGVEWGYAKIPSAYGDRENEYYRLQFKGDSIINNTVYKKLYYYDTKILDVKSAQIYALMREDGKKIYTRYTDSNKYLMPSASYIFENGEQLVYDFNKNVGDFIYENGYLSFTIHEISKIFVSGIYRNMIDFGYNHNEYCDFILEGAGPLGYRTGNIAFPAIELTSGFNIYHYLLYERNLDGTIVYKSPDYDDWISGDPTVIIDGVNDLEKKSNRLICENRTIIIPDYIEGTPVVVYSADGNLVYQGAESHIKIQQPGIYVVKTTTTAQKVMVK